MTLVVNMILLAGTWFLLFTRLCHHVSRLCNVLLHVYSALSAGVILRMIDLTFVIDVVVGFIIRPYLERRSRLSTNVAKMYEVSETFYKVYIV